MVESRRSGEFNQADAQASGNKPELIQYLYVRTAIVTGLMILAFALALTWISILSASGFILADDAVLSSNEALLGDESAAAAGESLGELRVVADSRSQVRSVSACNSPDTHICSRYIHLMYVMRLSKAQFLRGQPSRAL